MSAPMIPKKKTDPAVARRRFLVRTGLVILYAAALGLTFVMGKGHTILIDNKDAADGSYEATDGIMVSVDGGEALELYAGDRDMVLVKGQNHKVTIETFDGEKSVKTIKLPIDIDMLIMSVPKLQAGIEPAVELFVPLNIAPPADEIGNSNAFTSPGGDASIPEALPPDAAPLVPTP